MRGLVTYRKVTTELKKAEVETVAQLLTVLQEAGFAQRVEVEVFDKAGHRHRLIAEYGGETTGLMHRAINAVS